MKFPSAPKTLSVILPLFDLRNCRWGALESVLRQQAPRDQFEIIVILGRTDDPNYFISPRINKLLEECDRVIQTELNPNDPAQEIHFCKSGVEASRGNFLYFLEGHTTLASKTIQNILNAIHMHPDKTIFWGPRRDIASQPLGKLIAANTARHLSRAKSEGFFTLGGNSIIERDYFSQLGGIKTRYGRFNEVILRFRINKAATDVIKLPEILCYHYNDMPHNHLIKLARTMGACRFVAYSDAKLNQSETLPPARHFIFKWIQHLRKTQWLQPICIAFAKLFLQLATLAFQIKPSFGFKSFLAGIAFADLSGFCDRPSIILKISKDYHFLEKRCGNPFGPRIET